jgi:hypothetical protein
MVAHDPGDRPSSYRELREALATLAERHPHRSLEPAADRAEFERR